MHPADQIPQPFTVHLEQRGPLARLFLTGELDDATTPILERSLREIERDPTTGLIIDLSGLTFLDSSGLLLLLRASERAGQAGRAFGIVDPRPNVRRILRVTGTTHLLEALPPMRLDELTSLI